MAHEYQPRPPGFAAHMRWKIDRVTGVGDDHQTIPGHVEEPVGLFSDISRDRSHNVGTPGIEAVQGPAHLALKSLMGGANLEIDQGKVAGQGDRGVLCRFATVSNDDCGRHVLHLAAKAPDGSRVKAETAKQASWDVELDIGSEQHGVGPEQGQDLVGLAFGGKGIDQGAGITLCPSRQVIWEYVKDNGWSRRARHPVQ